MRENLGVIDRMLRVAISFAMLSMVFALDSDLRWFGLLGIVPLLSAFAGWCPMYSLFGISSCERSR